MIDHQDQVYEQMKDTPQISVDPKKPAEGNARIAEDLEARSKASTSQLTENQLWQLNDLTIKIKMDLERIGSVLWRRRQRELFDEKYHSHLSKNSQTYLAKLILNFNDVTSLVRGTQVSALRRAHTRACDLVDELQEICDLHEPEKGYYDPMTELKIEKQFARQEAEDQHKIEAEVRRGDRVAEPSKERCYDLIHSIFKSLLKKNLKGAKKEDCVGYLEKLLNAVCSGEGEGQKELGVSEAMLRKLVSEMSEDESPPSDPEAHRQAEEDTQG